ncbi:hypothetical protein FHS81_000441 [Pseudochelatococcus contaminans]|uniref:Chromosomal replication initiator DnaA C-terminal domain-containing protein n=2 Tax=Pseudochelatococcus contaminans TaxID=1538103 RepID=A0A7W6EFL1_9HYPH|nr:hypothetical protein [Pseudochelatococcus contaminans]
MSWNQCVQGGGSRLLYEAMICRQCEAVAASAFTAPVTDIRSAQRRCAPIAMARATAIHLAAAGFGLPDAATGRLFGRHRSTIRHACQRVEDRRETDPVFDMILACLDYGLRLKVAAVLENARAISAMGDRP